MDPKFQTSFIPKKAYEQPKEGVNLLTLIAAIVFAATLLGFGGVYFYSANLDSSLKAADQTIQNNRDAFDVPFITTMARLDSRIEASKKLLASHIALRILPGKHAEDDPLRYHELRLHAAKNFHRRQGSGTELSGDRIPVGTFRRQPTDQRRDLLGFQSRFFRQHQLHLWRDC